MVIKSPESAKQETASTTHLLTPVTISTKLCFNEEVEGRGYQSIVCSIKLNVSRMLAEAQFSCSGRIFFVGNLRLEATDVEPGYIFNFYIREQWIYIS